MKFISKTEYLEQRESCWTKLMRTAVFQDLRAKDQRRRGHGVSRRESITLEKQDDLLTQWNQLQQAYNQENIKLNDLVECINNIVNTIHDTERQMMKDPSKRDIFLDCLGFLLDNQIIKFFCVLCEDDVNLLEEFLKR